MPGNSTENKPDARHVKWAARLTLPALILAALGLAWFNRFVQDDAFISFRYARNFAEGHGLVWNVGERVEGYTNFLWTVCLTPAYWLGIDIVNYSYMLSLAAFACTLVFTYKLAMEVVDDRRVGWLAVALLATNYSFSCYATGGLETQFVTALITGAAWLLLRFLKRRSWLSILGAAALSACAVMTRMDATVMLVPCWLFVALDVWRTGDAGEWRRFGAACLVGAAPVLAWLWWRHAYYGDWVPNTFYIKSAGSRWIRGVYYVGLFGLVYGGWLLLPICGIALWRRRLSRNARLLGVAGILWCLYVVAVGGDFMEFRMLIQMLPLIAIGGAFVVLRAVRSNLTRAIVLIVVLCSSALHGLSGISFPGVQSVSNLKLHHREWKQCAETLAQALGDDLGQTKIAVTCAGIIPYYLHCPAVDLLGLNDREIARHGERVQPANRWLGARPGHTKIANYETVKNRRVHLLLNTPWRVQEHDLDGQTALGISLGWAFGIAPERIHPSRVRYNVPKESRVPDVVAWPMGGGDYLMTLYVTPTPEIDAAIRRSHAFVLKAP